MCRSSSPPIFFRTIIVFTLRFSYIGCNFLSVCILFFAFCRKLLFYSQADHFLNFVNTHTQFHFLKFIFASSSFENSFFFCCSFCVCNGNWTIYRKKEGVDATETIASWWWWWKKKQITLDFVHFLWNLFLWNRANSCVLGYVVHYFHWRAWFARAAKGNSNKRILRNVAHIKFPNERIATIKKIRNKMKYERKRTLTQRKNGIHFGFFKNDFVLFFVVMKTLTHFFKIFGSFKS